MADIKAKDIAVAQSITSSDLLLGSSIAGTTANVTVETVGKYILKQLNISELSNDSVVNFLNTNITPEYLTINALGKNIQFCKIGKLCVVSAPSDMHMAVSAGVTKIGTITENRFRPKHTAYAYLGNYYYSSGGRYVRFETNGDINFYTTTDIDGNGHNCAFACIYDTQ